MCDEPISAADGTFAAKSVRPPFASWPAMTSEADKWIAACSLHHLAERKIICTRIDGLDLIVVQDGEHVHACERTCPHEQADLSRGRVADGRLFCPRHLAWFSLHDGDISPGWSSRALRRYPIRIENGSVYINTRTVEDKLDRP